jgi:lysophospholipase L1-like esterase
MSKLNRLKQLLALAVMASLGPVAQAAELKFALSPAGEAAGFTAVAPGMTFDAAKGYGFLQPSIFAVAVGEGNYDVTVRLGDPGKASSTTIKAESRRLMLEKVEVPAGQLVTRTFTVNVRRPEIAGGGTVSLSDGEKGPPPVANWDEYLTLELNGSAPAVASIEVTPAKEAVTVYLAGDSTVTDQDREPWGGWGQMLPRFFKPGVAVSNHAWSGLALTSFDRQHRLAKVLSTLKPGDYVFLQFGHNDQKEKYEGAGPYTSYKANLIRYVAAVREKGGVPVLLSPMERRRWKDGRPQETLTDFAEAVRQAGRETGAAVIDLHAMSLTLYAAMGEEPSKSLFVFYPANTYPGQKDELKDNTHHNNFGGYELARCVVEGIKTSVPDLAARLTDDAGTFDPAKPDSPESLDLAPSPRPVATETPAGS